MLVAACATETGALVGGDTTASLELFPMLMGLFGGLALFLYGIEQMADALKALAGERLKDVLARLTTNRFTGAVTGAFVTAVIQSSSVTTVLTVGFITAGIMSVSQSVGVIFGANIGTTITAQIIAFKVTKFSLLLVSVGFVFLFMSDREKFRQYGAMIMGLGLIFFGMNLMSGAMKPLRIYPPFLDAMAHMENPVLGTNAHTIFNVANTLIFLPLAGQFARLAEYLVPEEMKSEEEPLSETAVAWTALHLDPALLSVPAVALVQARGEIRRMGYAVRHMLADIVPAFMDNDTSAIDDILERDRQVDYLQERVTDYLVRISRSGLNQNQSEENVRLLNATADLEHIGDIIEKNLVDLLRKKSAADVSFSAEGQVELLDYHQRVQEIFDLAIRAFDQEDVELAREVVRIKAELVDMEWTYRRRHYERLSRALPETIESSQIHLDLADYLRRINSYAEAIARSLLKEVQETV